MTLQRLFGGAITLALDGDYLDASLVRQVPDNQEVLLARDSNVSVILEVLQCVAPATDAHAMEQGVRYHFDSLAHDNSAVSSVVEAADGVDGAAPAGQTPSAATAHGRQTVPKFGKHADEEQVTIYVALWRLPAKNVDLVLSLNDPEGRVTAAQFRAAAASLRIEDWGLFP
ncbi:hypothetical protein MCAP1_003446 [Malassezia caprae]|uniref:Ran guanine nucleotide release factor n=1 Tax=Malassezia caprae TaxID=1381934 RepID=A0AAF0EAZ7_9BASI|nr:hypothetical protein MCAP1_003446 [Malassezia caprae]